MADSEMICRSFMARLAEARKAKKATAHLQYRLVTERTKQLRRKIKVQRKQRKEP